MASTCALFQDGSVKCWGNTKDGELGYGDTKVRGDSPGEMGDDLPVVDLGAGILASAIASSEYHTCVVASGNRIKCWGWNAAGQLGLGDTQNRGDNPGEMGDHLPFVTP